ncbi:MAG TPA: hypothetical protein VHP14_00735 [Anaerolineales bacterium]|nr:hypothetical protein [Anaerolineales bacterium]
MNTFQDHNVNWAIKCPLSLNYAISLIIAVLMAVVSIAGFQYRTAIYPTEELRQAFVPNDIVNLFLGVPILLGSMWLTWRGKLIGLLCWPGALFFVLYNYIAYAFAMPLGWAFLAHLVLVMLSVYALISLVASIDGKAVQQRLASAVPEKFAGAVLVGLGLLFSLRVIGIIASAILNGISLPETELAVSVADFLTTPAWIIGGVLLWRRKEPGYASGLGLLFQGSMLFIGLIVVMLLQPLLNTAPLAITDVIVIAAMGLIYFVPFILFARGVISGREG